MFPGLCPDEVACKRWRKTLSSRHADSQTYFSAAVLSAFLSERIEKLQQQVLREGRHFEWPGHRSTESALRNLALLKHAQDALFLRAFCKATF